MSLTFEIQEVRAWIETDPVLPERLVITRNDGKLEEYTLVDRTVQPAASFLKERVGWKSLVLKVANEYGIILAAKLVPCSTSTDHTPEDELALAQRLLGAKDLFAIPWGHGITPALPGIQSARFTHFHCFIGEWVDGYRLDHLLRDDESFWHQGSICAVASSIARGLQYLEQRGLHHNDLHAGNILVDGIADERPSRLMKLSVKIVDTETLDNCAKPIHFRKDDLVRFVKILVELRNAVFKNRSEVVRNFAFIRRLDSFIERLASDDPTRHFINYSQIIEEIDHLSLVVPSDQGQVDSGLSGPFEALSAEHLSSDELLCKLFVDAIPWYKDVSALAPVVLTGPRGCGKSTILRYLSLRTQLRSRGISAHQISELRFVGVYISCSSEIQNNLSWIARSETLWREMASEVATFFSLVATRELFLTLDAITKNNEASFHFSFDEAGRRRLLSYASVYLDCNGTGRTTSDETDFGAWAAHCEHLRIKLHQSWLRKSKSGISLGESFLAELTSRLPQLSPRFTSQPVVFLLDDYSEHRVPRKIQRILNRIVWERRASHIFKVSCEKYGFDQEDIDGAVVESSREFSEIDAGLYVLSSDDDANFANIIEKLVDLRLESANWNGRTRDYLPRQSRTATKVGLAREIRKTSGLGKKGFYAGIDILQQIWSGDVATILQVLQTMFASAGITGSSIRAINPSVQHDALVTVSRSYHSRSKYFYPNGEELFKIVGEFGPVVRDVLTLGPYYEDQLETPSMRPRIEMSLAAGVTWLEGLERLDEQAKDGLLAREIALQLLRRGIFVELSDGKPKEKDKQSTMRWEVRRIYLAGFLCAFGKNGYFDIKTIDEFRNFLTKPETYCRILRGRYLQPGALRAKSNPHDATQPDMFRPISDPSKRARGADRGALRRTVKPKRKPN